MLEAIAASKTTDLVIKQYDMVVRFPSGQTRNVLRIGHLLGTADLAILEIDGKDLREGVDYVVLPIPRDYHFHIGDEVVAVGNPGEDGQMFDGT
jgi:S1-C subfamily serine protease